MQHAVQNTDLNIVTATKYTNMQAGGKSGLTKALEELTTLLPKALECCSGTESSQNLPIVEKLRSVLLELIHGCLTCNAGGLSHAAARLAACSCSSSRPTSLAGVVGVGSCCSGPDLFADGNEFKMVTADI